MEAASNAIKLLIDSWKSLRESRPDEKDFSQFDYAGLHAVSFDEMFSQWGETFARATSKTKSRVDPEDKVMEARLAKVLMDARTAVDSSKANENPYKALFTGATFYQSLTEAGLLLATINGERLAIRKELIKV